MSINRSISLNKTNYLSQLSKDFLLGNDIGIFNPSVSQYSQLLEKAEQKAFDPHKRQGLVDALLRQYKSDGIELNEESAVYQNIVSLKDSNCYTITTGQQIHIFLGPLFFLHKINSLLGHVKNLKMHSQNVKVVPVFWMATEDHDLDEINYVNLYGEKFQWNANAGNAVGRIACDGLQNLINDLESRADKTVENKQLFTIFREHYTNEKSLASATRSLLNALFENQGLIIINPDDTYFKQQFAPVAKQEIENKILFNTYNAATKRLKQKGYKPKVNAQEINYFWFDKSLRLKINSKNGYKLNNSDQSEWSITQLTLNSEQLSPNVLARPLYQELILPNIAYIGGSAEIDYWLPLQDAFNDLGIQFPALLLRDSALYLTPKNLETIEKTGLKWEHLFLSDHELSEIYSALQNHTSTNLKGHLKIILEAAETINHTLSQNELNSAEGIKILGELQKSAHKLSKLLTDKDLSQQKADLKMGKVFKIKQRFFETKQERQEFSLSYPQLIANYNGRGKDLEAEMQVHIL